MDETSKRKGHDYITLFVDLHQKRTIFIAEGKGHETVAEFVNDLKTDEGQAENIKDISCDSHLRLLKVSKSICLMQRSRLIDFIL